MPDAAGTEAAQRILDSVQGPVAGRSRAVPRLGRRLGAAGAAGAGLTLADKQAVTRALLQSRRHHRRDQLRAQASLGDQGRPARRRGFPAHVVTLAISDVPGDDPSVIASGPTVPDPTTFADAPRDPREIRDRAAASGRAALCAAADETPKPGDPRLARAAIV